MDGASPIIPDAGHLPNVGHLIRPVEDRPATSVDQRSVSHDDRPGGLATKVPRWLEVESGKLSECETEDQIWDSDNTVFSLTDVTDLRLAITSVREKRSDHIQASYAIIGFTSETLGDGQFKIGGHAAIQAIRMRDRMALPAFATLRHKTTKSNRDFYKWES